MSKEPAGLDGRSSITKSANTTIHGETPEILTSEGVRHVNTAGHTGSLHRMTDRDIARAMVSGAIGPDVSLRR